MQKKFTQSGQSLIEILFAMTLFVIGVSTIIYLMLDAQISANHKLQTLEASALATEGLEVVRLLRSQGTLLFEDGVYGAAIVEGGWTLTPEPDVTDAFTRTITLTSIDAEKLEVESMVTWNPRPSRESAVRYTTYVTNWQQQSGLAQEIDFDVDLYMLTASGTALEGIALENSDDGPVYITNMQVEWTGTALLEDIVINGVNVFSTGSSTGVTSGTSLDISDYAIVSGGQAVFNPLQFSESLEGENILITIQVNDGSYKHVQLYDL